MCWSLRRCITGVLFATFLCFLSYFLALYGPFSSLFPDTFDSSSAVTITTSTDDRHANICVPLPSPSPTTSKLDFFPHHSAEASLLPIPAAAEAAGRPPPIIPFCAPNFTNYCPCQDPTREVRFHTRDLQHRERHCPDKNTGDRPPRCRVPRPPGYKTPLPWPKCRDRAWFANVPSKKLSEAKKDQNWVRVEGDWLVFPGGGTSFVNGVKWYVSQMANQVPLKSGKVRTALDIGCGVASFGGRLLEYNISTMSIAPRDMHEAQVQFALERGLPAMLGVLSIHRLPYPSRSFDMAHCARCLVQWTAHDGLNLLEIDRVLRPGGYWILSGPPINWRKSYKGWKRTTADLENEQKSIEDITRRFCWKKISEKGTIAVWQKPFNHLDCMKMLTIVESPAFCSGSDPDAAWYEKIQPCIVPLPKVDKLEDVAGGSLEKWPKRLYVAPPRITRESVKGITAKTFIHDNEIWEKRTKKYSTYISTLTSGKYRNIMDMNAHLGGFAAAMSKYPVWVMNVVPSNGTNNTLGIIYERGLIGTYMDWCEAFSTYPRTYDLIHADGLFSLYKDKCDIIDTMLEMDRILRPEGAVIIHDHIDVVQEVKRAADQLTWKSRIVDSENGPFDPQKFLIVDNSAV